MKRFFLILILFIPLIFFSCTGAKKKEVIYVIHAGSLSIPFKEMADRFMEKYPQVEVKLESHGSRTCARQIVDLNRSFDVMASADSEVIMNLMIPLHADFCINFTTNEMVVMYSKNSKYAEKIHSNNWYKILLKPDVQYGHSDPNSDPCGYRALLTWKLAEKHYKIPGLFDQLKEKMPERNIRPKEVDLIALLETNELDYIFIYRSVARQHGAKYIILPGEVNLKSKEFAEYYGTVSLRITGKKPREWIEKKGTPMVYGLTLPKNAKNPEWGIKFIIFILGKEGQSVMRKNGHPVIIPPQVDDFSGLPEELKKFFKNEI